MPQFVIYGLAGVVLLHGLIHLMGFVNYWELAEVEGLTYKTSLLHGRLDVGEPGVRVVGLMWLIVALCFAVAAYGLAIDLEWWPSMMVLAAVASLVLTALDYETAYAGLAINVVILAVLIALPHLPSWIPALSR